MKLSQDLVVKPIPSLIKKIAIPASIGFFFNTLYNVVDTYYCGLWSTQALAAISISFPIFFIIIAMGSGFSTGASALIANALGEGDKHKARWLATQTITFNFFSSILITVVGFLSAPALFRLLGANEEYLQIALSYTNVIFLGTIFFFATFTLNSFLTAQGNTVIFRNLLIIGFLLNMILDPAFMFGWWVLPEMGVAGVAWATVLIQFLSALFLTYYVGRTGIFARECWHMFKPNKECFLQIVRQGLPGSLNMMMTALGVFVITYFVTPFGKEAVGAFGIATRIDQIAIMPTIGLNVAVLTLVGQNNGAGKLDRALETIKASLRYGLIITFFSGLLVFIFAKKLMAIFSNDTNVIDMGITYLHISVFVYWAYVILFIIVASLQGFKKPQFAVWIGLYRQVLAPLIIFTAFVNYLNFGINGIWWGVLLITWSAAFISLIYIKFTIQKRM
ncbi:MAG TPA: MATE family efflux transporter [bacterium]|nr:MATE family efflux transporter [bacterium]